MSSTTIDKTTQAYLANVETSAMDNAISPINLASSRQIAPSEQEFKRPPTLNGPVMTL